MHVPSAIIYMSSFAPYRTHHIVNNFNGRPFNSVNDVVVHPLDRSIWFTDPAYGHAGGWIPGTGEIRVVADGFFRPHGITFSPDYKRCYITDSGAGHGDGYTFERGTKPATMYLLIVVRSDLDMSLMLVHSDNQTPGSSKIAEYSPTVIKVSPAE
jgi:gluconolactonase